MPGQRQPSDLQTLTLHCVGRLMKQAGRNMCRNATVLMHEMEETGDRATSCLNATIELLKEYLFSNVPWYLFDKMSKEVLNAVSELINETKTNFPQYPNMGAFTNSMNVVVSLSKVIIHPHLRQLDFTLWPKMTKDVLYRHLYLLPGLRVLDLGSGSGGWKTRLIENSIVLGLKVMTQLVSLSLSSDCTDNILSVIAINCPKLQFLDVNSTRSVTDKGATWLLRCKELKEVNLFRTSVTHEGYALLLLGLPLLESFGRYDDFGLALEYIVERNPDPPQFNVRVFQSRDVTHNHLTLLVGLCPKIRHISIYHDERVSDLTVLCGLPELTELKLLSCDFYTDQVKKLLELAGTHLKWLHLEHVEEIDINALMYIAQFCPNLEKLVFYNCDFMEHASVMKHNWKRAPFYSVQTMTCVVECEMLHLEFLLSNCPNVEYIQLGSLTGISDYTINTILLKNPMKRLRDLKILRSENLSMAAVRSLLASCDSLQYLTDLQYWEKISEAELESFRVELIRNNVDLETSPTIKTACK